MSKKVLIFVLILLTATFYQLSSGTETIQKIVAAFNYEIKLSLNGEAYTPTDDDGRELKPIIYEGRTYLPLKAFADTLGVFVDWDPSSKTVIIATNDENFGIPYNDANTDAQIDTFTTPKLSGSIVEQKVKLTWEVISTSNFTGYKVVASKYNSEPSYPNDGYAAYITDRKTTSFLIDTNSSYNGGDFDGKFISGQKYYFSITALYGETKVKGNVVEIIMP